METPGLPHDEVARLESLRRMRILSTPVEAEFDRITRTASRVFGVPVALVSLVDHDRQWFKSRHGLDVSETRREISFCGHAILADEPLVVPDAHADARFRDNPLVTAEPHIRFYAGMPLRNAEGYRVGTLCVIDREARGFSAADDQLLRDLARWAELALHARTLSRSQSDLLAELDEANRERLIDPLTGAWNRRGLDQLLERELAKSARGGGPLGVWFLDIDRFKEINDSLGHEAGDEAIRLCASIVSDSLRPYDVVGRFGGDEFVCLLPGLAIEHLSERAGMLLAALRRRGAVAVRGQAHPFTVSIGMTWLPGGGGDDVAAATILERADEALYAAKQAGRGTSAFVELVPGSAAL